MSNAEKARMLDEVAKQARAAASALRHGRFSTAQDKLDNAWDGLLQVKLGRKII